MPVKKLIIKSCTPPVAPVGSDQKRVLYVSEAAIADSTLMNNVNLQPDLHEPAILKTYGENSRRSACASCE